MGTERAHVPSLVAAAVLLIGALIFWVAGLLGELFAINRRLLQDIQYNQRRERADAAWMRAREREREEASADAPPAG